MGPGQDAVSAPPRGCPLLPGYDPLAPGELSDPFPSYARARREAPVFYSGQYGFWSVTRREDVLAVLRDTDRFSNRSAVPVPLPPEELRDRMPVYPNARLLLFLDDPEHLPARRMVQAPFTPRRLQGMAPMIRARAQRLLRGDDRDRRIEFVNDYATPLALAVIGHILGMPEEDFPMLREAVAGQVRIISGTCRDDEIPALARQQLEYWTYLCALVEERRRDPRDDFSSVLAGYVDEDGSGPTTEEIAGHVNTIFGGGFETSAQMMSFSVRALLENRDQWELLQSDRSLLSSAVEECLRYRSVVRRVFRVAMTDVEVGGVHIPAGALVAIVLQSTNRDESAFRDPDRFDITRTADNLAFGRGVHFCLGAPLARLELRVTLEALLDLAPDLRFAEDQELEHRPHLFLDALVALRLDLGALPASLVT
jgi:cytochrome P450